MDFRRVVIRKYENRRLYDTSSSRYVNLDDIAQMVREGNDVQVVDATTGEDLTRVVLTQIIVETAKAPNSGFPVDMLRQMVIASGQAGREGLITYMRALFDMSQNAYRAFAPGFSPLEFMKPPGPSPGAPPPAREARDQPGSNADQSTIDELRQRIEELERLVSKHEGSQASAKPKKQSRFKE
jgi:polyhydroxyalkanoate synthesis repressor PhaR